MEPTLSFATRSDDTTLVGVPISGFKGSENEVVSQAIDSMGGFTSMLAGLKALLVHDIELNFVAVHHPDVG